MSHSRNTRERGEYEPQVSCEIGDSLHEDKSKPEMKDIEEEKKTFQGKCETQK